MTLQNARVDKEFTHIRHFKDIGYLNGEGEIVPTRMTIVSRVDKDGTVHYKVGFCSRNEKQYNKKVGVRVALESDKVFVTSVDSVDFHSIDSAIFHDLVENRYEHMPHAHRRFAEWINHMNNLDFNCS